MQNVRSLIVQVSNKCPCRCPGCYNFPSQKELPTHTLLNFIRQYQQEFGIKKLTVSGGDPLMRRDIGYILDTLLRSGLTVSLDGVGSTLLRHSRNEELLGVLRGINCLGLPLDGMCTSTISLFRQGISYEQSLNAIRFADANQIPICINTVVHRKNIHEIMAMRPLIELIPHIKKWQLFQYMPIGPGGYRHREFFEVERREFAALADLLLGGSCREDLHIELKSLNGRKNKYLLLGCDGLLWIPQQTRENQWDADLDENDGRVTIGTVEQADIFQRIKEVAVL